MGRLVQLFPAAIPGVLLSQSYTSSALLPAFLTPPTAQGSAHQIERTPDTVVPILKMEHKDALAAWDANASFWDAAMGSTGNDYYRVLELPALKRMVQVKKGERALDLATGNGLVAHWLAQAGANVIATDGSREMLDLALMRGKKLNAKGDMSVQYRFLDVTDAQMWEDFIEKELSGVR